MRTRLSFHLPALLGGLTLGISPWLTSPATASDAADDPEIARVETPQVSPHDDRDYRILTLENGLTTLLVSDPDADKAAASMNVGVGSASNPEDLAGLAHFLEHMLFLGTEPYPEPDAYQSYINQHGGAHNAFTAQQDTNYFFDIEPEALPGALDRFSRFFVSPLFNADQLESERNVVHSEYQSRLRDDGRRINDVLDQALNSDNPTTGFSVGSRETLADRGEGEPSLRERVIEFYETHYDANVMHLAIVAPQSLDELETLVREHFVDIEDRGLTRPQVETPLVERETLPTDISVQSIRDSRQVRFMFPVDDPIQHYRHKPASYLANLLGHEGEGSLLSVLREAGLADGLSAGVTRGDGNEALFSIDISLTPDGASRLEEVQASLFRAIGTLDSEQGLAEWRYDEQARLAEQEFRFQQHGAPQQSAMRLAMNLAYYPVEDVNYAPYRMDGFERDQIERYLSALRPDSLIRLYSGPEVEGDAVSPWFQAAYRLDTSPQWRETEPLTGFALPEPNPYIAEDLTLLDVQDDAPRQLIDETTFALWHQADSSFSTPKVEWRFSLQHPEAAKQARDAALSHLLAGWLNDSLNAELYPARLAGQRSDAYAHARGITLSFSGWRDRQERVMNTVLTRLKEGTIDAQTFDRVRYRLEREWRNAPQAALHQSAQRTLGNALIRPQWPASTLLEAVRQLGIDDLRDYRQRFLSDLHLEAMAVGNLEAGQAQQAGAGVAEALTPNLDAERIPELKPLAVSQDLPALHPNTSREESLVLRYLQGPDRSLESQARLALLGQLIETPFYVRLRTEQQLGYVVNAGYAPLLDAPGLLLLVQSPETPSEEIQTHIDAFLERFETSLDALDDAALAPHRQAVADRLLQRDTSLSGKTNRLWRELAHGETDFDRRERLAEHVRQVRVEDVRDAWHHLRRGESLDITFDPGDTASDVLALTAGLAPLPEEQPSHAQERQSQ
ncbi:insulinase family protein [Litchfieldella xinjiangensis]|uniref:insulinase family protein n=1 Tax=Litchfieldella xinjiangensis TaxID=1166948 RepID=UPI0005B9C4FB|nr:insulinase family protein [Halomonas xinjiangensis]